jgi:hypothetical protein
MESMLDSHLALVPPLVSISRAASGLVAWPPGSWNTTDYSRRFQYFALKQTIFRSKSQSFYESSKANLSVQQWLPLRQGATTRGSSLGPMCQSEVRTVPDAHERGHHPRLYSSAINLVWFSLLWQEVPKSIETSVEFQQKNYIIRRLDFQSLQQLS